MLHADVVGAGSIARSTGARRAGRGHGRRGPRDAVERPPAVAGRRGGVRRRVGRPLDAARADQHLPERVAGRAVPAGSGLARRMVPGRCRLVLVHRHHRLLLRAGVAVVDRVLPGLPPGRARSGRAAGRRPAGGVAPRGARRARRGPAVRLVGVAAPAPSVRDPGDRRPAGLPVLVLPVRRHVRRLPVPALRDQRVRPARAPVVPRRGPGRCPGHGREAGRDRGRRRARRPHARDARGVPSRVDAECRRHRRRCRTRRGRRLARPGLRGPRRAPPSSRRARRGARDRRVVRLPRR